MGRLDDPAGGVVWWYPPDSVVDTATQVPVEEYLFMVEMTLLVGCWTVLVALPPAGGPPGPLASWRRPVCAAGWLLLAGCGATAAALSPRALYLGSALAWFGPPLALQSAVGADVLHAAHALRLRGMALARCCSSRMGSPSMAEPGRSAARTPSGWRCSACRWRRSCSTF